MGANDSCSWPAEAGTCRCCASAAGIAADDRQSTATMIRARRGNGGMNTSIQYAPLLAPDRGCSSAVARLIISVRSGRSARFGLDTLLHRGEVEPLGVDVA